MGYLTLFGATGLTARLRRASLAGLALARRARPGGLAPEGPDREKAALEVADWARLGVVGGLDVAFTNGAEHDDSFREKPEGGGDPHGDPQPQHGVRFFRLRWR